MESRDKRQVNADEILCTFLIEQIPAPFQPVFRIIASLNYPIRDLDMLERELDTVQDVKEMDAIRAFLRNALRADDPPFATAEDALALLLLRLQVLFLPTDKPITPLWGRMPPPPEDLEPSVYTDPCREAARRYYAHCYEENSDDIPRLLGCAGNALKAELECHRRLDRLSIEPPLDACSVAGLWRYASCVVWAVVVGASPEQCRADYLRFVYDCRRSREDPRSRFEEEVARWRPTLRPDAHG